MRDIEIRFTSTVAKPATQFTSAAGITRTRVKVDIPVTTDPRTGETSIAWATVTGTGKTGDLLATLDVGDAVYVEGSLRIDSFEKNGVPAIGLNVDARFARRVTREEPTHSRPPSDPPSYRQSKHEARGERRRHRLWDN